MKILVTGGSGYTGGHTCKALAEEGHDLVAYDNLGFRDLARRGAFGHGDLCDYSLPASCMRRHRPDGVIHSHGVRV
ncbi:MAG: NAD-dependent epimerase/dehydratase family protein [Desulfovibrio sp.]|jgi:UDP-arabinose 4-epimerase|nr:NAD-dependent epimerase/dehydratase family protein [Desulfovibrio sp.]